MKKSTDGKQATAIVSFFSDLPTGGSRHFRLQPSNPPQNANTKTPDLVTGDGGSFVIDTGTVRIRVPDSRVLENRKETPGPIMSISDRQGWMGASAIGVDAHPCTRLTTEVLDRGPLFARVRVTYNFAGGGRYVATIKAAAGENFIRFNERMTGMPIADGATFDIGWTDFAPTHRRGRQPIDSPRTIYFRGEDPFFVGPPRVEDPEKEMIERVGPSGPDRTVTVTSTDFTDDTHRRAIGVAVRDASLWSSADYSIWNSNDSTAIKFRYADRRLHWTFRLTDGTRDTLIAAMESTSREPTTAATAPADAADDESSDADESRSQSINFLNSRQGGMSLDVLVP